MCVCVCVLDGCLLWQAQRRPSSAPTGKDLIPHCRVCGQQTSSSSQQFQGLPQVLRVALLQLTSFHYSDSPQLSQAELQHLILELPTRLTEVTLNYVTLHWSLNFSSARSFFFPALSTGVDP